MVRSKRYLALAVVALVPSVLAIVWGYPYLGGNQLPTQQGQAQIYLSSPLTLNTVPYAETVIKSSLAIPRYSASLGASYNIIGVLIDTRPHTEQITGYNGTTYYYTKWATELIIWNGKFVNGTTNQQVLNNGGVTIMESSAPPGVNSTRSALSLLAPSVVCTTHTALGGATETTCQTLNQSNGAYIKKIRGLAVIVSPQSGAVTWLNDKNLRWYQVTSETVGIDRLLAIADTLIP